MKLKEMVIEYRHQNNLSQRDFAKLCDLSHGTISLIEKGINPQTEKKMSQDMDTLKKLANGMGISMQKLFEEADDTEGVYDPMGEDQKLLLAYHKAPIGIQSAVRKLLDIEKED